MTLDFSRAFKAQPKYFSRALLDFSRALSFRITQKAPFWLTVQAKLCFLVIQKDKAQPKPTVAWTLVVVYGLLAGVAFGQFYPPILF